MALPYGFMSQPRQLDDLLDCWLRSFIPCISVSTVSDQKGSLERSGESERMKG